MSMTVGDIREMIERLPDAARVDLYLYGRNGNEIGEAELEDVGSTGDRLTMQIAVDVQRLEQGSHGERVEQGVSLKSNARRVAVEQARQGLP